MTMASCEHSSTSQSSTRAGEGLRRHCQLVEGSALLPREIDALDHSQQAHERPLETPHLALTLSGRLMGDLRAVVRVLIGAVKHRWQHRATGGRVAAQLVGDQASRHVPLGLQ